MRHRTKTRLKRLFRNAALILLIPPAALLSFRLAWGVEASHRLANARAHLHALGLPATAADLPDPTKIPADQDAVAPFLRALSEFRLTRDDTDDISPTTALDLQTITPSDRQVSQWERIAREHQSAFEDLDLAAARNRYAWPLAYSFYYGHDSFRLSPARDIALLLAELAIVDGTRHRDADAFQNVRMILSSSSIFDHNGLLIEHLVAIADSSIALQTIERLLPAADFRNPATQSEAKKLLAESQKDFNSSGFEYTWAGETVFLDSSVSQFRPNKTWLLSPIEDDDEAVGLANDAAQYPIAAAHNYPESKAFVPPAPPEPQDRLAELTQPYSPNTLDLRRVYALHARTVAFRRAASILLASYLFREVYGHFPIDATELMPEFLSRIPTDPFDAADKPLRYRVDPGGPTVWSVGENGVDDSARLAPGKSTDRFRGQPDFVFGAAWRGHLEGGPAAVPK